MEWLIAVAFFALAFTGMAIGVILSNRRIKGSCGGIANVMGDCRACDCGMQQSCSEELPPGESPVEEQEKITQ